MPIRAASIIYGCFRFVVCPSLITQYTLNLGAENLRRVATDAKTRGSVSNILQKTDANLRKLQEELNELHAQVDR